MEAHFIQLTDLNICKNWFKIKQFNYNKPISSLQSFDLMIMMEEMMQKWEN